MGRVSFDLRLPQKKGVLMKHSSISRFTKSRLTKVELGFLLLISLTTFIPRTGAQNSGPAPGAQDNKPFEFDGKVYRNQEEFIRSGARCGTQEASLEKRQEVREALERFLENARASNGGV